MFGENIIPFLGLEKFSESISPMKRLLFGVSIIDIIFWESFEALLINSEIILVLREFWKNSSYFFLVVGDMFGNFRESYCFFNLAGIS